MESSVLKNSICKKRRAIRVRQKLRGNGERPRLCFFKSNLHLQAQLIDDEKGVTLGAVATHSKEFKQMGARKNKEYAQKLGQKLAQIALEKEIKSVIFDRGSSKYHGVVAAFADAARESGLKF